MKSWFGSKVRARLGPGIEDYKEVSILGRIVGWTEFGIKYEADPKHRQMIWEYFGFDESTRSLVSNGDKGHKEDEGDAEPLENEEPTRFRGLAASANFLSLDCPDLQFPVKEVCREMANPTQGSWKRMKKIARFWLAATGLCGNFAGKMTNRMRMCSRIVIGAAG